MKSEYLKNSKKKILIIALVILILSGVYVVLDRHVARRIAEDERSAALVAVTRAKRECANEGLSPSICETVEGVASTTECDGSVCWPVTVVAKDKRAYAASMIVQKKDGQYTTRDYLRGTGE